MSSRLLLKLYYAATAVFVLLDFVVGVNVRVTFFEGAAGWRVAYYAFCFLCLAVTIWRPALSELVGAAESLIVLAALIVTFGSRVMLASDALFAGREALATVPEIVNFAVSGAIAYFAWLTGMHRFFGSRPD